MRNAGAVVFANLRLRQEANPETIIRPITETENVKYNSCRLSSLLPLPPSPGILPRRYQISLLNSKLIIYEEVLNIIRLNGIIPLFRKICDYFYLKFFVL